MNPNADSVMPQAIPLADFMKIDFDVRYIIEPLLASGGIGLLHGKGGHGKTQLAFTITEAVSSGRPLFGKYEVEAGKVLIIEADMPDSLFQDRLSHAFEAFSCPENIIVLPTKPFNIEDTETQDWLRSQIESHDPRLIIFDTLRKIHVQDENDNAVPSRIYAVIRELQGDHRSSLIVHHDRKSNYVPKGAKTDAGQSVEDEAFVETFRGARAWVDDSDLGLHLLRYSKDSDPVMKVVMRYSKLRCAPQPAWHLRLNEETLLLEKKRPETARDWAEHLFPLYQNDLEELRREVKERAGCSRQNASRVVGELLSSLPQQF